MQKRKKVVECGYGDCGQRRSKKEMAAVNAGLLAEARRKMALSDWHLRLTFEEACAVREFFITVYDGHIPNER